MVLGEWEFCREVAGHQRERLCKEVLSAQRTGSYRWEVIFVASYTYGVGDKSAWMWGEELVSLASHHTPPR